MPSLDSERAIERDELSIPMLSASSAREACQSTLKAGLSVTVSDEGYLWEIMPDGRKIRGKKIEPRVPVQIGTKVAIQMLR